jgi:hypothetical protein
MGEVNASANVADGAYRERAKGRNGRGDGSVRLRFGDFVWRLRAAKTNPRALPRSLRAPAAKAIAGDQSWVWPSSVVASMEGRAERAAYQRPVRKS